MTAGAKPVSEDVGTKKDVPAEGASAGDATTITGKDGGGTGTKFHMKRGSQAGKPLVSGGLLLSKKKNGLTAIDVN